MKTCIKFGILSFFIYTTLSFTDQVYASSSSLKLSPASQNITPGQTQTVDILLNTGSGRIDSLDLALEMSGTIPGDLNFTSVPVQELSSINTPAQRQNSLLVYAVGTLDQAGYSTNSTDVKIAKITFTAPSSGTFNINFHSLSAIISTTDKEDVLIPPSGVSYSFGTISTPTPSPVVTPSPSPYKTPSPTICPAIPGDSDNDCIVGPLDYIALFENFGKPVTDSNRNVDFNKDNKINSLDYVILYRNYSGGSNDI